MRRTPFLLTAAALVALAACNRAAAPNGSTSAEGNAAAPANASAPAAGNASGPAAGNTTGPAATGAAAAGNGLWGVAEPEDEASHRGIDFIAFNRTGRTVTALSLRPDEGPPDGPAGGPEAPWSANALTQTELPDGTRAAVHFEADIELCRWQLRATFADRSTRAWPSVDLCNTIRVDLR